VNSAKRLFKFRLFIVGNAPNSVQALENLRVLCHKHLHECHQIEVVDVLLEPRRALSEGILLTPTLVKISPPPACKIIGSLSQPQPFLQALGLSASEA
jgi:circadian clock protein KaiB